MMKNILAVIAVALIIAIGAVAYSFFKTPEEASGPIEAIPITIEVDASTTANRAGATAEETNTAVEETEPAVEAESQEDPAEETDMVAEPEAQAETGASTITDAANEANAEATSTAETVAEALSEDDEPSQGTGVSQIIFDIVQAESEARFLIDEVLRGAPNTVVGATDQMAGQFAVNPSDLSTVQVGIIRVNTRTLATDNNFRNRAIKNQILLTDDYEFVTFTPTEIVGLPERGAVGETYTFQIVGDLTITDVTKQVTFDVTATPTSETRLEGSASTTVLYTDFELFIPDSPSVDTVDDEVHLELEFVAEAIL